MKTDAKRDPDCANPGCGRVAVSPSLYCETCELEWMLYRRDLRAGTEKESPAVESR
jgi:hypothetical protein